MKAVKRLLLFAALFAFVLYKAGFTVQESQGEMENNIPNLFPSGSENLLPAPSGASDGTYSEYAPSEIASIPNEVVYGEGVDLSLIPVYSGKAYTEINENVPYFAEEELVTVSFELYDALDELGRCTCTYACIGPDLMPTEERGAIGMVKPTGWHTVKYDCIEDLFLYNRCHLIGYQLTGENANECNLLTGTRYMNVQGMLPFENKVANYIRSTGNHVLYRVTPIFDGRNLLANGVQIEARSVEDDGKGVCFNVFCYNVQPGIVIDYTDGSSYLAEEEVTRETADIVESADAQEYVLNTSSMKFHIPSCSSVEDMAEHNKKDYTGNREELIEQGYSSCGRCMP